MKRIRTAIIFLGLLVLGCSSPADSTRIRGEWKAVEMGENLKELSPQLIQSTREIVLSSTYTFKENNVVLHSSLYYEQGTMGTWRLDEEAQKIYLEFKDVEGYDKTEYIIVSFSGSEMTWINEVQELGHISIRLERQS